MASETVRALDGVDLEINEGERIILLGPSALERPRFKLLICIGQPDIRRIPILGNKVPKNESEAMTTFRERTLDTFSNSSIYYRTLLFWRTYC